MNRYLKLVIAAVAVFVLVFLLCEIFFINNEYIYIGVAAPLTIKNGSGFIKNELGIQIKQGVQFYFDNLNANGGINGKKVKVIYKDDQNNIERAKKVAIEFSKDKRILAVIGHRFSGPTLAASKYYSRYKIPMIAPTASNPLITRRSPYIFRMVFDDTYQAHFTAHYTKNILKAKTVAIIYTKTTYGMSLKKDFKDEAKKIGLKIIGEFLVKKNQKYKLTPQIIKRLESTDVVYLSLHHNDGIKFMNALSKIKLKTKFLGGDSIGSRLFAKYGGKNVEGVYGVNYFIPDILGYKSRLFMKRFEKRYKRIIGWGGAMAYEASHLLAEAIKFNGAKRENIKNFLSMLNSPYNSISGITGNLFFDRFGNCMRMISMARVFGGEYKSAKLQISYVKNVEMIKKRDLAESFLFKGILMSKTLVVYTGVYVNQIETFDVKNSKFTVNFILWFRWWGKSKDIKFKLIQAEELNRDVTSRYINPETGEKYICYKIRAKFKQEFSFQKYPFDDHILKIRIRDKHLPSHKLRFVIDVPDAALKDRYIGFEDWENVSQINFVEYMKNIKSFRDPRAKGKTVSVEYPVYNYHIKIKRMFLPYLVKFILPLIFILAVAFLAFFIHPKEFETNIAIGITALLSAIAFHITQGENLPNIGYIVTADLFFIFTYALIFLSILESVISNALYYKNKLKLALKADRVSVILFPLFLVLMILIIILRNS